MLSSYMRKIRKYYAEQYIFELKFAKQGCKHRRSLIVFPVLLNHKEALNQDFKVKTSTSESGTPTFVGIVVERVGVPHALGATRMSLLGRGHAIETPSFDLPQRGNAYQPRAIALGTVFE